jgi:hypothetical protein
VLAGTFDLNGDLPVNPDGGLKSFGHPVGASGLRMMFEAWLQLRGEAPRSARSARRPRLALTHNLGGYPGEMVSFEMVVRSSATAAVGGTVAISTTSLCSERCDSPVSPPDRQSVVRGVLTLLGEHKQCVVGIADYNGSRVFTKEGSATRDNGSSVADPEVNRGQPRGGRARMGRP